MVPHTYFSRRIQRLYSRLSSRHLDGAILSSPEHIYYFTGLEQTNSPAFLIVSDSECCLVNTDTSIHPSFIEHHLPYQLVPPWNSSGQIDSVVKALNSGLDILSLTGRRVALETHNLCRIFLKLLNSASIPGNDIEQIVLELRYCKDEEEVKRIRFNQEVFDLTLSLAQQFIQPGINEIELHNYLYTTITSTIHMPFCWEGTIGGGHRSAYNNPQPSGYTLQVNDLLLVDIFSRINHYYGDITRTFILGKATSRQHELHKLLEEAIETGKDLLKPGICAGDVDFAIRKVIADAGLAERFPHHSGHGVGLWQQEAPYILPDSPDELQQGNVIALEPGIYLPDFGGMRLENLYLVTENGPECLNSISESLLEIDL